MKKIIMTGGGTAGHVMPCLALVPELAARGYEIYYIGTYNGIEKGLVEEKGLKYFGISSGKLRRYFSFKNFTDPFRVIHGFFEAKKIIKKLKPDIVFSKGGFVTVPVVFAAHRLHVPIISHESDITPGLANRLCIKKADYICTGFKETLKFLPKTRGIYTGSPIRAELLKGDKERGYRFTCLTGDKPIILIIGGSTGASKINESVYNILPTLLKDYGVIHITGKGKKNPGYDNLPGYISFEYVGAELPDVFAVSDLVISRAGANSICELLALNKPNILIPLSLTQSRGDQILNADSFEKQGFSYVLREEEITNESLIAAISYVLSNKEKYINKMKQSISNNAIKNIADIIDTSVRQE